MKWMTKYKGLVQFTFYRRIQISFLFLILLPTLAASLVNYYNTRDTVREKIGISNEALLSVMARDISQVIDNMTYATNLYTQDPAAIKQIRSFAGISRIISSTDYESYKEMKEWFSFISAKTQNANIFMFLVNTHGFIVQANDIYSGGNPSTVEAQAALLQRMVDPERATILQWLGPLPGNDSFTANDYFIARVIRDPIDYSLLGILYIAMPERYFSKLFEQATVGSLALFDANGRLIAGNPRIAYTPAATGSHAIRNEISIGKADWKLVLETDDSTVTGEISRTFYVSVILIVPFFLLFFVISIVLARRLHRPIRNLQQGVRQFGDGNRQLRFEARGNDEIADLGRTLNQMLDQIHTLITDIETEQEQKRVLELQALFSQIRPHFLLNTLNSIKYSLVLEDDIKHSQKIDSLMSLLRAYLKFNEPSTLRSECKLLQHYVDIMQIRNDLEINYIAELEPDTEAFELPRLLLQPIVENAIVHGFQEDTRTPSLWVRAQITRQRQLVIVVKDNGVGCERFKLLEINELLAKAGTDQEDESSYRRIGIMNVMKRLRMTYGSDAEIQLVSNEYGGVSVILTIPLPQN
ncbi:cache domain-containing sensor histidine kinase [Paenibacillus roseipurpureus]|uniref:Histidine kinase n=1 Tax=Paenibacillus roseopurpureus TaxID=2918901 RepID=A0AA96LRV3_9BACL|nr:histidine kinase [Paenibacillus sp. MBLB1832]WNR46081.1 histidine kinase [Paenibacillus sp. MBLB1832]